MNNIFAASTDVTFLSEAAEDQATQLLFVDDATYEFVGGGMAANGL